MPEISLTGVNQITYPYVATWHWEVAVYLFLGGLVAGLMVVSGALRLSRTASFTRAVLVSDLVSLPLLAGGLLLLWLDLANRWRAWRFYVTFQVSSAMSWGAWILLLAMVVLGLRLLTRLPVSVPLSLPGWLKGAERVWAWLYSLGQRVQRYDRLVALLTVVLGTGVGFYTGVLLSTIAARPLWNSAVLAPLFLVSGLVSGLACLMLALPHAERVQWTPLALGLGGVELVLLLAYVLNLAFGNQAAQRAGSLLLGGPYSLAFWGLVVLVGLALPLALEGLEWRRSVRGLPGQLAALLHLTGGVALRFVIVYAGLHSYI